jgi:hypothetical protein
MALLQYTTYEELRAVLGVSATELPDLTLAQPQFGTVLTMELQDISTSVASLYTTISAIPEVSRTANQQWFYDLTRLTAAYAIASNLLISLPLFSVSRLTDGRAEFERQKDIFADVRDAVNGMYAKLKARLAALVLVLEPTATVFSEVTQVYTASIGLGTDPVTGA